MRKVLTLPFIILLLLMLASGNVCATQVPAHTNIDYLLNYKGIILAGTVHEVKHFNTFDPSRKKRVEVTISIFEVLNGKYAHKKITFAYRKGGDGDRWPMWPLVKGMTVLVLPPDNRANFLSFHKKDFVEVIESLSGLWFSKETEKSKKFLKAMGAEYYSKELALRYALEWFALTNPQKRIAPLEMEVKSEKWEWVVIGRCSSWFGCPEGVKELCFSFNKFRRDSSAINCVPSKYSIWQKLKFW